MALQHINPTTTAAWSRLKYLFENIRQKEMKQMFADDPSRADRMSVQWQEFLLDYSKNRVDDAVLSELMSLVREVGLDDAIKRYFSGDAINSTEKRAVLHTALRAAGNTVLMVDGEDVMPEIARVKSSMKSFCDEVISGSRTGYTGKAFTDVVNIGIGGSDLGPAMAVDALAYYRNHLRMHFVSNVDGDHVHETLKRLNPETTLFVIVSKTFSTQETLSNAETIRGWFLQSASPPDVAQHFIAVSTNVARVTQFGIAKANIFPMWDWVGGRFSLWSSVGLSIALSCGFKHFEQLLQGAGAMDDHFRTAGFEENIPVILASLSVWYNNFFGAESHAVIPYTQYLHRLPAYLQQGIMESNGKRVGRDGKPVDYQTGAIIWGEPGTNAQHAFFQLLHQGTKLVPADFIAFAKPLHGDWAHHDKLMSNFFAQTEAFLMGKTADAVRSELQTDGASPQEIEALTPFKVFEGNRPTNTLLIETLTPYTFGALVAMYEHKIFVEGVVWNIFSYDQWGVELGKQLANNILRDFENSEPGQHDSSTQRLIQRYRALRKG